MFGLILIAIATMLATTPDAEDAVVAAAEKEMQSTYPEFAPRLEFSLLRGNAEPCTTALRVEFRERGVPRGHTQAQVFCRTSGGWESAGTAMLHVSHFDSVAIPLRDIERLSTISDTDISSAWIDVTRFNGTPLSIHEARRQVASDGAVAERTLRAGEPLRRRDIRPPLAADTGDAVKVEYARHGLRLELKGKARGRGSVDDEIRVYVPETESTYRVRLVAPGRAVWLKTL